jgi:hypothetical protein
MEGPVPEWFPGKSVADLAKDLSNERGISASPGIVLNAWNARRQANYERDNAQPFTHYIDSVAGSNANNGTSPATPWQTLGQLTTAGVAAGARIGLKRGSTFTGNFTVPTVTGTLSATNRIVFGAYGTGAAPKIQAGTLTIAQPYIDVQDIRFTACTSGRGLFIFHATPGVMIDNKVKRCEFDNHTSNGGLIMGTIGGLVEDCYFHDIWNNVEYPGGDGYATLFTTSTDGTEVRYNLVKNCYKGLGAGNTHRNLSIHHNIVIKSRVNGIDISGGVIGHPAKVVNNFVWHRPTTANGHGIDIQAGTTGNLWRNNIVYSDYVGASGNVQLYCIASTTYTAADTDIDYNLGWIDPTASGVEYAKLGSTVYISLATYQTALNATSYGGKEARGVQADPLLSNMAGEVLVPTGGSPCIDAGATVGGIADLYLGAAPDLGPYEVA